MQNGMAQPQIKKMLMQKASIKRVPISGTFEITPLCNMNCRMCYIRMTEKEMNERGTMLTAEDWIELGKECVKRGMLFLLITGGEPFLRKDFRYIYEELTKLGLSISLNSNATLIDENVIEWLKDNPPSRVNVTLYGGNNETYEKLCGLKNGYDKAVRGIELMREAGIMVYINASFTKYNVSDMEEITGFASERGLRVRATSYMFPPVRNAKDGNTDDEVRFTPEEAAKARAACAKLTMSEAEYIHYLKLTHAGICAADDNEDECVRIEDAKMRCTAGKGSFWVTWDGRMTPCGMMNEPVVRCRAENFFEGWQSIVADTEKICTPVECESCSKRSACVVCGALCIAEGKGDSSAKPEYVCRMTEHYLEILEQEYNALEE